MLRTPSVTDSTGGARSEKQASERGQMVKTADQVVQLAFENGLKVSPAVAASLLPTPVVNDMGAGKTVEHWDEWTAKTKEKHQNGNGHGPSLNIEMLRLLPTTTASDWKGSNNGESGSASTKSISTVVDNLPLLATPVASEGIKAPAQQTSAEKSQTGQVWLSNQAKDMEVAWGKFEPAIRRWEAVLGRPAPAPTKPDGKDGAHRLSSKFTEWMMGLPEGWITDVGLTRNEELKACGNGVVPQQAELALRLLLQGTQHDTVKERVDPATDTNGF